VSFGLHSYKSEKTTKRCHNVYAVTAPDLSLNLCLSPFQQLLLADPDKRVPVMSKGAGRNLLVTMPAV
jgi:hypothetical protein